MPNDGVWYAPLSSNEIPNTLKLKVADITYSLCEPFVDTENYTYDENGRLIAADPNIWLEGTGTQYIDTGHNPTTLTRTEIDLKFTSDTYKSSGGANFFGVGDLINIKQYSVNFGSNSDQGYSVFPWLCRYQKTPNCNPRSYGINATLKTTKQTFVFDVKNKIARYGTVSRSVNQPLTQPIDYSIYLFGQHAISAAGAESAGVYSRNNGLFHYAARIYEDDVLVKHFVPVPACMRIGDFVVPENGMWDIVNQQFYGNSGTGEFIYGKD